MSSSSYVLPSSSLSTTTTFRPFHHDMKGPYSSPSNSLSPDPITTTLLLLLTFFLLLMLQVSSVTSSSFHDDNVETTTLSRLLNNHNIHNNNYSTMNSSTLITILNQVLFPRNEVMDLEPVNQFYYPMLFPFDVQYDDFCQVQNFQSKESSFCREYLCESSSLSIWDLRNKSQIMELGSTINYCLYCNQSQSNEFRRALQHGECQLFTMNEFTLWSQVHCNNVPYSKNSQDPDGNVLENYILINRHLGIFDFNFLFTPYFQKNFLKYRRMENESLTLGDALKEVKLEQLFQFYFSKYVNPLKSLEFSWNIISTQQSIHFSLHQSSDLVTPPLDVPFTCWCNYQNPNEQYFAFQCDDFYQKFLFHLTHRYFHIVFCITFAILAIMISFLILYPKAHDMISITLDMHLNDGGFIQVRKFNKFYLFGKRLLGVMSALSSISVQSPTFFVAACCCGFLENFFKFIFNFSALAYFHTVYFKGFFRAMCCVFIICGYSSLVISWSHLVSTRQAITNPASASLSIFHKSILGLFYGSTVIVMVLSGILYVVTSNISYAWISLASAGLFYLLSFVAGFAISGLKILYRLRQLRKTVRTFEYRFTKLMLLLTLTLVSGWIIALLTLFTYMFGFDSASLFYGITRNVWLDCGMISVTLAFTYMTFNVELLKKAYRNSKLCLFSHKKKSQNDHFDHSFKKPLHDDHEDDEDSSQIYYTKTNANQENRVEVVLKTSSPSSSNLMTLPFQRSELDHGDATTTLFTTIEEDSHDVVASTTQYSQFDPTE